LQFLGVLGLDHALEQYPAGVGVEEGDGLVLFEDARDCGVLATDHPGAGGEALPPDVRPRLHVVEPEYLAALGVVLVQEQAAAQGADAPHVQRAEIRHRYGDAVLGAQGADRGRSVAAARLDDMPCAKRKRTLLPFVRLFRWRSGHELLFGCGRLPLRFPLSDELTIPGSGLRSRLRLSKAHLH